MKSRSSCADSARVFEGRKLAFGRYIQRLHRHQWWLDRLAAIVGAAFAWLHFVAQRRKQHLEAVVCCWR